MNRLMNHSWPGNIRELENVLLRATALSSSGTVTVDDLDLPVSGVDSSTEPLSREQFDRRERARIAEALARNRWNVARTARQLGIPRSSLYRKLKKMGVDRKR